MNSIPVIKIEDAGHGQGAVLELRHYHDGRDLQMAYAEKTLMHLHRLWERPVTLETVLGDERTLLGFDQQGFTMRAIR